MEHDEATRTVHRLASLMPRGAGVGLSTSMVRHGQVDRRSGVVREGDDETGRGTGQRAGHRVGRRLVLNLHRLGHGAESYYLDQVVSGVEDYYVGAGEATGLLAGYG
jgi:hypothetical protein